MSPRIVDKVAKRRAILEAAIVVFSEYGIDKIKMADIARQAQVGKGTLYEYFSSKEELTRSCMEMVMEDLDRAIGGRLFKLTDPIEKIRCFIDECFAFFARRPDIISLMGDFWAAAVDRKHGKPLLISLGPRYRDFQKWMASILQEGIANEQIKPINTMEAAAVFMGIIDGLMFQMMLGVLPGKAEDFPDIIFRTFMEGIAK